MVEFEELGLPVKLCEVAREIGWASPTPVQEKAVPAGLSGSDIIVRAQTGTGKTGAYAFITLSLAPADRLKPYVVVITPTRELAMQVDTEMGRLSKATGHTCVAIYGGADIDRQIQQLRRGADVIVGTPGRIKDLVLREALDLSEIGICVIDEADRLLDMGFEEELNFILDTLPQERQTLMLSATMEGEVEEIAQTKLKDPVTVDVSGNEMVTGLTKQYLVKCMRQEKRDLLTVLLNRGTPKTIVFFATKSIIDEIYQEMRNWGLRIGTLHGDMPQQLREKVIAKFRDNYITVLLATDVAARGIDISDVDLVVNYDLPRDAETYVHRIGRTGRAGKTGVAVSLATGWDMQYVPYYEEATGERMEFLEPTEMEPILAEHPRVEHPRPERKKRDRRDEKSDRRSRGPKSKRDRSAPLYDTSTVEIDLGKADGYKRVEIANIVRKRAKLDEASVGRVGLAESASFVEVPSDILEYVIDSLDGAVWDGRTIHARAAPRKEKSYDREE